MPEFASLSAESAPRPRPALRRRSGVALLGLLGAAVLTGVGASPAAADEVYVPSSTGTFAVEGHGWGHGHGLSQYGAQGAASLGLSADTITSTYYPGTARATIANAPIRVRLSADEGTDTQVFPATGLTATDAATGASVVLPTGPTRWRVVVDAGGEHVQSLSGSTWSAYPLAGRTAVTGPVRFAGPTFVRLAYPDGTSRDYRGAVAAVPTGATTLASVDVLTMEDYLLGVVPRESSSSWQAAALQAQAIAARSYSAYERAHVAAGSGWDICDSTSCQVFGGSGVWSAGGSRTDLEPTSTTSAVHITAGVVRTYGGTPIFAQFSASNGGWSTDGGAPYLRAQRDDWDGVVPSTVHSWTATLRAADLEAHFPVGHLLRLRVTSRDGNGEWGGRVLTVVLEGVDSAGQPTSVDTTGRGIYSAASWPGKSDGLRSSWWHILTPSAAPSTFVPVAPTRLLDTRSSAGPVGSGGSVSVQVAGVAGVPSSGVTAVALNVTAVAPTASAFVTVYPSGQSRPQASNLNTTVGITRPNLVVVRLGGDGRVVLYNSAGSVQLLADLTGYWTTAGGGSRYVPLTPARLLDTRTGTGPVGSGQTLLLQVSGRGQVPPSGATAVVLNLTTVDATAHGYVTAYQAGQARPTASSLNPQPGIATPNLVIVPLGSDGRVALYNSAGSVQLVADVAGYATGATTTGSLLTPSTPVRLLDTRTSSGPVGPGGTLLLQVAGRAGIPAGVHAVVLNLTAVDPTASGFVTAFPSGQTRPTASNLNTVRGQTAPNLVVVKVGADGKVALYNSAGSTSLLADLAGWYAG